MDTEFIRCILFARYPVAGCAKTRLIPKVGPKGAAQIHKILAQKTAATIAKASQSGRAMQFILSYTGGTAAGFENWLCVEAGIANIHFIKQPEGNLTDRLLAMIDPAPVIFFGSDTPDLTDYHIAGAANALQDNDVVIGPALDGGYYLIGMNAAHKELFRDMTWSDDQVLSTTLSRCQDMGLKVHLLEMLSDCDTPEDLMRWPWLQNAYSQTTL